MKPPAEPRRTQTELFAAQAGEALRRGEGLLAAGDLAEAERWLSRAWRIARDDPAAMLALGLLRLRLREPDAAIPLLAGVVARCDSREAGLALAAAHLAAGDPAVAARLLHDLLARHVAPPEADGLAEAIVAAVGAPGWCGVRADGQLVMRAARGRPMASGPADPRAAPVAVTLDGRHLLGSPLRPAEIWRLAGVVGLDEDGRGGWAWHPGAPECDPVLTLRSAGGRTVTLTATDRDMPTTRPLARPRRFRLPGEVEGEMAVTGPNGRPLPGSLLTPARLASPGPPRRAHWPARRGRAGRVAIVVPVYRDLALTRACLDAVRATVPPGTPVIVVDDASPEPGMARMLNRFRRSGAITLIRHRRNRGFPAAANAGLRHAASLPGGPDVVLLNSDALVTPGWLAGLRRAVGRHRRIGTATPLSNDATILSFPDPRGGNPMPTPAQAARLAREAAAANGGTVVDIPTGIGFCLYIRHACLRATGLFRTDLFAQGYGEENDFCERARAIGWRHVGAPGVFVAHAGGQSFADAAAPLRGRNLALLKRLHPGYGAAIDAFLNADPLAHARRRLAARRWSAGHSVLIVTHDSGGGVERAVRARCAALAAEGRRPILLRPDRFDRAICRVGDGPDDPCPNLRFRLPDELPALARLLAPGRPAWIEVHHLLGHHRAVLGLAPLLGLKMDWHVHDYAAFCPRLSLLGPFRRYCGEPRDPADCDACVAAMGRAEDEALPTAAYRRRGARDLAAARQVIAPSADAAARLRRHFPALSPVVVPHEDDTNLPPCRPPPAGRRRVAVPGAIGPEKGYDLLLACARDAAARDLPLDFVVIGHSADDDALLATGRCFVTGPYRDDAEALALFAAHRPALAFLPSIIPETWSFTLGLAWRAGLPVAAFDLGAPADRLRATGRGWLLPLGLPLNRVNDALLAVAAQPRDV